MSASLKTSGVFGSLEGVARARAPATPAVSPLFVGNVALSDAKLLVNLLVNL